MLNISQDNSQQLRLYRVAQIQKPRDYHPVVPRTVTVTDFLMMFAHLMLSNLLYKFSIQMTEDPLLGEIGHVAVNEDPDLLTAGGPDRLNGLTVHTEVIEIERSEMNGVAGEKNNVKGLDDVSIFQEIVTGPAVDQGIVHLTDINLRTKTGIPPKTAIHPVMGENRPKNEENVGPLEKERKTETGGMVTIGRREDQILIAAEKIQIPGVV